VVVVVVVGHLEQNGHDRGDTNGSSLEHRKSNLHDCCPHTCIQWFVEEDAQ
jgi:hypothetical protein